MDRLNSGLETEVRDRVQTYGHAAVSTDDRNGNGGGQRGVFELFSDKGRCTDYIQSGNTEEPKARISSVSRGFM